MPTYVYETITEGTKAKPRRYEIRQSIKDSALTRHPETGEAIRRVLPGTVSILTSSSSSGGHAHTSGCGCGAGGCGR